MDMIMNTSLIETWELPSLFVRITLAIFRITLATPTITLWNTIASIWNHPRHLIYFSSAITGLHVYEFLKLCFHTSGGIIADHMSDYG